MSKWAMIIDVAKCHNCRNCFLACKDEHVGNDYPGYAAAQPLHGHEWITVRARERGQFPMVDVAYLPAMCNHCDDAPCMKAAPDGAVYKRPDGIVIIDPIKAKGRADIVKTCPYGMIWWNDALKLPQIWAFDAHLLDRGWSVPRCVQACPTGAMQAVKTDDESLRAMIARDGLAVLNPEFGTRPRVFYKNLHRFMTCFIGGTLIADVGGRTECVAEAGIRLLREGAAVADACSDAFGDFKIDGLHPQSGRYDLLIEADGYESCRLSAELDESRYLGEIRLTAQA